MKRFSRWEMAWMKTMTLITLVLLLAEIAWKGHP